jgi:glycine hydroxymethyltransferase
MVMCKEAFAQVLDKTVFPGIQGGPLMHVIASKAVAFKEALDPSFKDYQKQIVKNAQALAEALIENGARLVSGGTDTHLMLIDLRSFGITGKVAEAALESVNITVNKNTIPYDPEKPFVTSGIRVGTPAVTSRGMKEPQMKLIAKLIVQRLRAPEDAGVASAVRAEVDILRDSFPLYRNKL